MEKTHCFTDFIGNNVYKSSYWCRFGFNFDPKKRIVVVFDQIEYYWSFERSAVEDITIFLKNLAETANSTNHVVYLLATNDAYIANEIININERSKVAFVGDSRCYKWSKIEVTQFFKAANFQIEEFDLNLAINAGTPRYCADLLAHLRDKNAMSKEVSAIDIAISREAGWAIADKTKSLYMT